MTAAVQILCSLSHQINQCIIETQAKMAQEMTDWITNPQNPQSSGHVSSIIITVLTDYRRRWAIITSVQELMRSSPLVIMIPPSD